MNTIERMLIIDEGLKLKPYKDTEGVLTIGIGKNLEDVGISEDEAIYMLRNDIKRAVKEAREVFGAAFDELDAVRQNVIVNMMFNLGKPRFLTFRKFIKAVKEKDFKKASVEMLDSKWAKQVKDRAERLAYMMRTGEVHPEYLSQKSS